MEKNSALEICQHISEGLNKKANHNKRESLWGFKLIMLSTLTTPVLLNISDDWIVSKLIPSVFALIASFFTAWIKLRKPESLWGLYRTSQRKIENEIRYYQFSLSPYDTENADEILIKNVTEIYDKTHDNWLNIIPNIEDVSSLNKK